MQNETESRHNGAIRVYRDTPRVIDIRVKLPIDLRRKLKMLTAKMEVEQGQRVTKDDAIIMVLTEWFAVNP